jgi:hypothetical protein
MRRASSRLREVWLAALLALATGVPSAACGGKSAGADASGAAGSSGAGGGAGTGDASSDTAGLSQGACGLVAQDCPAGTRCDFFCDVGSPAIGCRPGETGAAVGQTCSGAAPCSKGTGCFATSTSGMQCRSYCDSDADCATGTCHVVHVAVACAPDAGSTLVLKFCF